MSEDSKKNLFKQAGILAIAGIISRIIGLLYNSPLAAIIGDEGNGYYSGAFQAYTIVLMISAFSIPSAISKIIAGKLALEEYRSAHRIFKCALIYVAIVGGIGSLALFMGADLFADDAGTALVLRFFAPTVFLFGFLGVLRGYFQAHRTMTPTSISQLLEQILNAVISVFGALWLTKLAGDETMIIAGEKASKKAVYGAIGSSLGTGSGVITALIFMCVVYFVKRDKIKSKIDSDKGREISNSDAIKLIVSIVTPFILSTCIYNLSGFLNFSIFSRVLRYVREMKITGAYGIKWYYGIFTRKAMVITNIPIAFSAAAASAMIPEISTAFAKGDKKDAAETVAGVMRVMMMISIPCGVGLFALARPVMMILFPQKDSLGIASFYLAFLAITVIFYSVSTVTNAVLQGTGKLKAPVVNAAIALVIQGVMLVLLLSFTDLIGEALCIVTIVYSLLMCILNNISMKKHIVVPIDIKKTYVLPAIAASVMGIVAYFLYAVLSALLGGIIAGEYWLNLLCAGVSILVAIFVYFAVLIKIGGAAREDILKFPKGRSLVKALEKIKLL
ncbi:putative polysaccharide biosynthesis protein [Butyrivibrio sp. AE2005]|uniref:putative polysaccharide biosynthesis protein n=1 Tax=Butyrivibrio sp. AE2005 TaxID=1496722 RepID=UPI00047894C5|nr:polysaccharide biosynthesis protein [Butyrivibrio sp. AE2005]